MRKYHIVKSDDPKRVAKHIYDCPVEHRPKGEGAVRWRKRTNHFVSNFKGSEHFLDRRKYTLLWSKAIDNTDVAMIEGVNI